jgi:glycosyltransferase involved in cell wall biosynthesis
MPKLSIITINLNNANGLQKTIKSVINQKYTDFEWIMIDGGSSDVDLEIIKNYSNLFSYWLSEPDNGIYHAMNKGINKAQGDYCFFLNSGDSLVNEEVLQKVFAEESNEDVIFGNLLVMIKSKVVGKSRGEKKLSFLDIYTGLLKHQAAFIRRDLFDKFGLYNEDLKIISDWEFFIKTIGLGEATYRYIDLDISYFDNDGISNNNEELVSFEKKAVIDKYVPLMIRTDYEDLLKYAEYRILTKYWSTNLLLRVLTKIMKVLKNESRKK